MLNDILSQPNGVYVIAEVGINHNGDMALAKRMIEQAKEAGVDCAKFQSFRTELLVRRDEPKMPYQVKNDGCGESQFTMLKKVELSADQHRLLMDHCAKVGIDFLSTPYDTESADLLFRIGARCMKVASTDTTNLPFLRYLVSLGTDLIVSSGVTSGEELEAVAKDLFERRKAQTIAFLHCVSNYPAPLEELNLRVIATLEKEFRCPIGFSDHTEDLVIGAFSVMAGARIVEKHFTFDKQAPGPDHKASLTSEELKTYVCNIRRAQQSLGDGKKRVMPSESSIKLRMQKSLVAARDLAKGTTLSIHDITSMRPATGISPLEVDKLVGQCLGKDIVARTPFSWEDMA